MRSDRHQNLKQKKRKKSTNFLLILFILLVGTLIFAYVQYKAGISQSLENSELPQEEYEFNGDIDQYGGTNILLLGSDARKGEEVSRADTIMVAQYHPDKGTYKIISLMRDMYVDIPGYGKNKINAAFALGGPELLRQTIKENFDLDLKYYSIVNFEGFVHLIDEAFPNGVEIEIEKEMSENIGVTLEPGLQRLDGKHLLGYVRFRQDAIGDFGRVERQQNALKEVASQITSVQTIPKLPKLIGVLTPFINTNMSSGDILYIGKDLLTNNNPEINSLRIPVDGSYTDQRISGIGAVLAIDNEMNKEAIKGFLAQ